MPGLQSFISKFNYKDLARPNRFDVMIPVSPNLKQSGNFTSMEDMSLICEIAELPSRTFSTAEQKFTSMPVQKFPYMASYNDLTLTFIVDDSMNIKYFFDAWMSLINPVDYYTFEYKNNYAVDITINQYDMQNTVTYSIKLEEAYPIAVNQLDLDWSSDGHHKLVVVFAYNSWKNIYDQEVKPEDTGNV
jgi:hypothetical protein